MSGRGAKMLLKLGLNPPGAQGCIEDPVYCEFVSSPKSIPLSSHEKVKAWVEHAKSQSCPGFKTHSEAADVDDKRLRVRRVLWSNRLESIPEKEEIECEASKCKTVLDFDSSDDTPLIRTRETSKDPKTVGNCLKEGKIHCNDAIDSKVSGSKKDGTMSKQAKTDKIFALSKDKPVSKESTASLPVKDSSKVLKLAIKGTSLYSSEKSSVRSRTVPVEVSKSSKGSSKQLEAVSKESPTLQKDNSLDLLPSCRSASSKATSCQKAPQKAVCKELKFKTVADFDSSDETPLICTRETSKNPQTVPVESSILKERKIHEKNTKTLKFSGLKQLEAVSNKSPTLQKDNSQDKLPKARNCQTSSKKVLKVSKTVSSKENISSNIISSTPKAAHVRHSSFEDAIGDTNNNLESSLDSPVAQLFPRTISSNSSVGHNFFDEMLSTNDIDDINNHQSPFESPLAQPLPESVCSKSKLKPKPSVPTLIKKSGCRRRTLVLSSSKKETTEKDGEDALSLATPSVCSQADSRYSFRKRIPAEPLLRISGDDSSNDSNDSLSDIEWAPSDPRINETTRGKKTPECPEPEDGDSNASGDEDIIVTLPKKTQRKAWEEKLGPRKSKAKKIFDPNLWEDGDLVLSERLPHSFTAPSDQLADPIEYFEYFFDEEFVTMIANFTNISSTVRSQGTKCLNVTPQEIRKFLGVLLYMGLVQLPSLRDYWGTDTAVSQVSKTMPYNRFAAIRSNIHYYDKSKEHLLDPSDRFCKVRVLFNHMQQKCNNLEQENDYSIDESMIPYKGKFAGSLRQYIPSKPHRFGIKLFILAGASGMVYDFLPYAGASTFNGLDFSQQEVDMGVGAQVVIHLARQIDNPESKALFFDNFFSGVSVVRHLLVAHNLRSTGTIRCNRIEKCPLKSDADLQATGRGSHDTKVKEGVQIIKWLDNKVVHVVSTLAGLAPLGTVNRYDKVSKARSEIPIPLAIKLYNRGMGGVDLHDMLVELYRTPTKAKRWYMTLISYMLDMATVNSWLLYRRHASTLGKNSKFELKQFRLAISKTLRGECSPSTPASCRVRKIIKNPRAYRPDNDVRYDGFQHWPSFKNGQSRCKFCKTGYTTVICARCDISLCFVPTRQCFSKFHIP